MTFLRPSNYTEIAIRVITGISLTVVQEEHGFHRRISVSKKRKTILFLDTPMQSFDNAYLKQTHEKRLLEKKPTIRKNNFLRPRASIFVHFFSIINSVPEQHLSETTCQHVLFMYLCLCICICLCLCLCLILCLSV